MEWNEWNGMNRVDGPTVQGNKRGGGNGGMTFWLDYGTMGWSLAVRSPR